MWYNWLMLLELDGKNDPIRKYAWGLDLADLLGSAGVPPAARNQPRAQRPTSASDNHRRAQRRQAPPAVSVRPHARRPAQRGSRGRITAYSSYGPQRAYSRKCSGRARRKSRCTALPPPARRATTSVTPVRS